MLRAEKGYIIVGQETDGTVTPDDAGLGWAIGKGKPDFVGKRSLERLRCARRIASNSWDCSRPIPRSCWRRARRSPPTPGQKPPMRLIGHVTSSYASAVLGRSIALAMVVDGRARIGQTTLRADAAGRHRRRGNRADVLRSGGSAPACLRRLSGNRSRSRPQAWCGVLPRATRLVFRGDRSAQDAAGAAFGVAFAVEACRAASRGARAALWLGPDEHLLISDDDERCRIGR